MQTSETSVTLRSRPGTMLSQRTVHPSSAARGDLVVPRIRLQLGNRAFCVAGPVN